MVSVAAGAGLSEMGALVANRRASSYFFTFPHNSAMNSFFLMDGGLWWNYSAESRHNSLINPHDSALTGIGE